MNVATDSQLISRLAAAQRGVFSTADLRTALAEPHAAAFGRRIRALQAHNVLFRFIRGFYVTDGFDLAVLSRRIAPNSCISFETVLARNLVIGANPVRRVVATKVGRTRSYAARGFEIEHVGIAARLLFGCEDIDGVLYADAEKAVLDVLYYHLRGRRYVFDIYSDINLRKLDMGRLREYLRRYRNPRFVAFAKRVLGLA